MQSFNAFGTAAEADSTRTVDFADRSGRPSSLVAVSPAPHGPCTAHRSCEPVSSWCPVSSRHGCLIPSTYGLRQRARHCFHFCHDPTPSSNRVRTPCCSPSSRAPAARSDGDPEEPWTSIRIEYAAADASNAASPPTRSRCLPASSRTTDRWTESILASTADGTGSCEQKEYPLTASGFTGRDPL